MVLAAILKEASAAAAQYWATAVGAMGLSVEAIREGEREGECPTLHRPSAAQPRNVVSPPFSSVLQAAERE
jgi:hypothetical protein